MFFIGWLKIDRRVFQGVQGDNLQFSFSQNDLLMAPIVTVFAQVLAPGRLRLGLGRFRLL